MMTIMMKVMMKVAHSGRSALSREHFSFFISLSFYNSYRNYGFRNISVACCGEKGHSQSIKLRGRQHEKEERREAERLAYPESGVLRRARCRNL